MAEAKKIRIAVSAKMTMPLEKLEPFQGELKTLPKEEYEQLRGNILKYGFSFAIHVWQDDGHNYIIDGHQRVFALTHMKTVEKYVVPELPVALVEAKSFKEAKEKVLAGTSQYGKFVPKGLHDFMTENNIPFETVVANFKFSGLDFGKFNEQFINFAAANLPAVNGSGGAQLPSSSGSVKMVQLFFESEDYAEFTGKLQELAKKYETENITDSVMEAVRAQYKIEFKGEHHGLDNEVRG